MAENEKKTQSKAKKWKRDVKNNIELLQAKDPDFGGTRIDGKPSRVKFLELKKWVIR